MNLLGLVVWCGILLSCTVSLHRKRQIKYLVTKFQNHHNERSQPTALEILERTLLQSSRERSHPYSGRKRLDRHIREGSTTPLYSDMSRGYNKEEIGDYKINSCVASFGDESPLCKPKRRHKKSFIGIPDFHRRLFRSDEGPKKNVTTTAAKTLDDFFGVFKNDTFSSKFNATPKITTAHSLPKKSNVTVSTTTSQNTSIETTTRSTTTQKITFRMSEFQPRTTTLYVNASSVGNVDMSSKIEASKIILPGSLQKFESEPQFLYLERFDSRNNNLKVFTKEIEETEGEVVTVDDKEDGAITVDDNGAITVDDKDISPMENEIKETPGQETTPTLQKVVLPGEEYSKTSCESETNKRCICSISSVDFDLRAIFNKSSVYEEIMAEVASMKCGQYIPEPSGFDLNTNAKPRVLKGKHTPFAVDSQQGAKEVTETSLDEFIAYSAINDGVTRVFVSSDVKLPCFPKPDVHLSATEADHVKYSWTFGSKREVITQGRITEEGDGSLMIHAIQLTDAMNYTCEIDYIHPDTGERTIDSFVHSLSVVALPIVSTRAMVLYKSTAACDESILEIFEMYLPQQVEKTICSPGSDRPQLCSVVVHSPVCHDGIPAAEEEEIFKREAPVFPTSWHRAKREERMEMSLNLDVFIHGPGAKRLAGARGKTCDPDCFLLVNFKLLQILKESTQEVALIPIVSKVQDGGTFTPVPNSVKVKYIFGCIGGYYLDNGFCLACPKGTYSEDGATVCQECPMHTYSGTLGMRRCTPCKHLWMPICNEYFESVNIMLILYVVGGVVLLIAAFILYYIFVYKGQTWKEVMEKSGKEKVAKSERIRSRKEAKLMKAKLKAENKKTMMKANKEIERLLHTSGESGTESEPESKY